MPIAPISLFNAYQSPATEAAALAVLRSGQIAAGPLVAEFQQAIGAWLHQPHLVTTNDMSSAMLLALHLAGVRSGDEVLSSAYTCMSSVAPIANLGARPRWVDVEPTTGLMDPAALESRISPRTKACVVYHAAGYPARVEEIAALCRRHHIALIEDCNTAMGATLDGQPLGQHGQSAVFSFYPNRQINAADGGALALRDGETASRAQSLRRFGIAISGFRDALGEINPASDIPEVGWSAAMSQLNSALGLAQLPGLSQRLAKTQQNAHWLLSQFDALEGLRGVKTTSSAQAAYWGLLVLVDQRDDVLAHLKRSGIQASKLHHRLDTYSGLKADPIELPGMSAFLHRVIALPCGDWLNEAALQRVAETTIEAVRAAAS